MESLHRCPLCGSSNIAISDHFYEVICMNYKKKLYMVHCKDCGVAITRDSREQAVSDWNKKCEEL